LPASPADTALGVPGRIEYVTLTYANLGATRLKGADVEAEYRFRTKDWGRFTMRGVVSYLTSYRAQSEPGAPMFEYAGVSDLPRFRMVASLRWTNGPWDLIHSWRHTGEQYQDVQFSGEDRIKAENYHDVSVNYTGIKKLSLGLTIRNIMDRTPSFSNGESQNYSYAFGDPRGRSFQLNAKYTF
jgi:iron complex outermembrane receptor protein